MLDVTEGLAAEVTSSDVLYLNSSTAWLFGVKQPDKSLVLTDLERGWYNNDMVRVWYYRRNSMRRVLWLFYAFVLLVGIYGRTLLLLL